MATTVNRSIYTYMDQGTVYAATGDVDLAQKEISGEVEVEYELSVDGSCGDAGLTDFAFSTDAGSSGTDAVDSYGVNITRDPTNTSGEAVDAQFSVSVNGNGNLTIVDQNSETSNTHNAGRFVFKVTVTYSDANNQQQTVTADPRLWNLN